MRIAFLTGSLEPGQDGVGDYTALLARECAGLGTTTRVIALADRTAKAPQTVPGERHWLRIPASMPWRRRVEAARCELDAFRPDWVSVQFVPYSFHRWGIALRAAESLPRLARTARLHVMLHEIWNDGEGSWRRALLGAAQRWSIARLCGRAALVHTSNGTYRRLAGERGLTAAQLPLFGSVPIVTPPNAAVLEPLAAAGANDILESRSSWWVLLFFGTIHPEWTPEPLLTQVRTAAAADGKRVAMVSVGRTGAAGARAWTQMQAGCGAGPMLRVGEQSPERIGEWLQAADFGVSTTPYSLLGKSATAVAMLEHGLPIIVPREDGPAAEADGSAEGDEQLMLRLDARFGVRLRSIRRRAPRRRLPDVARQLLQDMERVAHA